MTALTSPLSAILFIILTYASRSFASRRNGLTDPLFDPLTGLCIIPDRAAACFCSWNSVWQSKGSPMQSSSTGANFDLSWLDPMPLIIKPTSVLKSPKIPSKLEISEETTLCAKICRKLFQTQKIFKLQTGRKYEIQKKRIEKTLNSESKQRCTFVMYVNKKRKVSHF